MSALIRHVLFLITFLSFIATADLGLNEDDFKDEKMIDDEELALILSDEALEKDDFQKTAIAPPPYKEDSISTGQAAPVRPKTNLEKVNRSPAIIEQRYIQPESDETYNYKRRKRVR